MTKLTSSLVSSPGLGVRERISRSAAEGESVLRCVMKGVSTFVSDGGEEEGRGGGETDNRGFRHLLEERR